MEITPRNSNENMKNSQDRKTNYEDLFGVPASKRFLSEDVSDNLISYVNCNLNFNSILLLSRIFFSIQAFQVPT